MKLNNVKLPFGLIGDKLKHIDDVPNGRACGCVCPKCNRPLQAKNAGEKNAHHFSHDTDDKCTGATETATHLMAKQIIAESKVIKTPVFDRIPEKTDMEYNYHYGKPIKFDSKEIKAEQVILEETLQGYKPDIIFFCKKKSLLIEIKVTHKVDENKQLKVKNNNDAMMEIDLSNIDKEMLLDMGKFQNYVIYEAPRHWIHNPLGESLYTQSINELNSRVDNINISLRKKQEELQKKKERQANHRREMELQNEEKTREFEIRKKLEREKHEDKLNELKNYLLPSWQSQREILQRAELAKFPIVEKIKNVERTHELPQLIDIFVENYWIFNVHRSVWQADILKNMIFNNAKGKEIKSNDVKRKIVSKYGILPVVKELNNLKHEWKKVGKERDTCYQDEGCWFFSKEENRSIPSPFKPIIEYLKHLSNYTNIIMPIGNNNFSILISSSKEYINLVEENKKRSLIATEKWEAEQKVILEKEEAKRIKKLDLKNIRTKEIIASEKRIFELFNGEGRLCKRCFLMSHSSDGDYCPFCSANEFQASSITTYDIENAHHRYRCYTSPSSSIESNTTINNELLSKWLNSALD